MSFRNEYILNVDIKRRMTSIVPTFKQGDSATLKFRIFDDGKEFDLLEFTRADVTFRLPSNQRIVGEPYLDTETNMIVYNFAGVEMSEVGKLETVLSIYSGTTMVSIQPFSVWIFDHLKDKDLSYIGILQDLIAEVEFLEVEVHNSIREVNNLKDDFNNLLETTAEAEKGRHDNEQQRITNEDNRKSNEITRQDNEIERIQNDQYRQSEFNNKITEVNTVINKAEDATDKAIQASEAIKGWDTAKPWRSTAIYIKNNVVTDNGSTWQALRQSTGAVPIEGEDWTCLARKGVDGNGAVSSVNNRFPNNDGNVEVKWSDIPEKPAEFSPSPHPHEISDIKNLQISLNEKATQTDLSELGQKVIEYYDEIGTKYLSDFNIVADGITDDTVALQNAVNYCSQHKLKLRNGISSRAIKITTPIYLDGWNDIDLSGAKILKTTNTLGIGSNKQRNSAYTTSYAVDAIFIIRHTDNAYTSNLKLKNIVFSSNTSTKHKYAIYAPFLVDCEFENLIFENCEYGLYGYCWYLIPTVKNLKADSFKAVVALVDDGTQIGSSTSINFAQIYGTNCVNVITLYGLSYAKLDIPCGDHCTSFMLNLEACKAIVVDSPSTEHARNGNFISISNSDVVINAPNAYQQHVETVNESYMIFVSWYSRVTINGGTFENFDGTNLSNMFPLIIKENSHVLLNNVRLPSNGNGYTGLSNSSSITKNNENGRSFMQVNGSYILIDKLNDKKITQSISAPTDGNWSVGDVCYNTNPIAGGYEGWLCVTTGTPGTWKGFGIIES